MVKKVLSTVIALSCITIAMSQTDSTKKPAPTTTFTYSVDAYYRYSFNDAPNTLSGRQITNNYTSFTNSKNSFELGMASVRVDHSFGKIAATADLGFGRRAEEFSYNDGAGSSQNGFTTLAAVKQAYISYAPSSAVKFTVGKWATHIGWELLDAYSNRNYSMSYGFSYGPFSHTGIKADISLGGKSAFMVGITNPTDQVTTISGNKAIIAQFSTGTKDDKFKAYLNFHGGHNFNQYDVALAAILSSKFSIDYDGTIKTGKDSNNVNQSWSSNALYFNFDPTSKFGLTLRGEYFNDNKDLTGIGSSIFQTTLSANIHLDNLTLIPEIRLDNAKDNLFTKGDGKGTKSNGSFILAAVYKF